MKGQGSRVVSKEVGRKKSIFDIISYFLKRHREIAVLIVFLVLTWVFYSINPLLMTPLSWSDIILVASEDGIVAIFVTLLLIGGEFDLSVGSVFVMSGMVYGMLINNGYNPYIALLISLALSALVGLTNGLIVVFFNVSSFIETLGMEFFLEGLIFIVTGGFPIAISLSSIPYWRILSGTLYGTLNVWPLWFIALALIAYIILENTSFGNHIFATGGSLISAYAVGVNVRLVKIILFILSSLAAGFTGILSLTYFTSISPVEGETLPLIALAIAVIGGSSLSGGSGTIQGTVIASLLIGLLYVGLTLAKVPSYWYIAFLGLILIIIAVANQKISGAKLIP